MWHKNDGPKPNGEVIVRTKRNSRYLAEWSPTWNRWSIAGAYEYDQEVIAWHEIPPFEEAEHGCRKNVG